MLCSASLISISFFLPPPPSQLLGTVVIVATATPYSLVAYVPLMTIFYFLQRWFRTSSRELKRLDAVSRSPVYNHFTETLDGLSIIRAHDAEGRETIEAANKLDSNIKMVYMANAANRWLSIRLEVIGGLMLVATAVFGIVSRDAIGPENVGLAVSYSLTITVSFNMCLRMLAEAENAFNSVERVLEMCDVKPEKPLESTDLPQAPKRWPAKGEIVMKDVVMSYRPDLDPVLNGLSVTIPVSLYCFNGVPGICLLYSWYYRANLYHSAGRKVRRSLRSHWSGQEFDHAGETIEGLSMRFTAQVRIYAEGDGGQRDS